MKRNITIISILLLFLTTSCSNLFNQNTTNFNFNIDNETARTIQDAVLENTTITDDDIVSITCSLKKLKIPAQTQEERLAEISKAAFSFQEVPFSKEFDVLISVSYKNIPLYTGIQKNIEINEEETNIAISLEKARYNIIYNLNGGKNDTKNPVYYTLGTPETELLPAIPAKEGVKFLGWYSTPDFQPGTEVTKIGGKEIGEKTIYASWGEDLTPEPPIPPKKCSISYTDTKDTTISDATVNKGSTLQAEQLPSLNQAGYNFLGWYSGEKEIEVGHVIEDNITLSAHWETITYNINYNLNSGTNNKGNPATYNVETPTISLKNPTRNGYTFKGWYTDSEFTEKNKITEITKGSTGEYKLYANWEATSYTITYHLDKDVTNSTDNPKAYTVETPITLQNPTRTGYKFISWHTSNNFTDENKITEIKGRTGNIDLYAKWEVIPKDPPIVTWSQDTGLFTTEMTIKNDPSQIDPVTLSLGSVYDFCFDKQGYIHILDDNGYTTTNPDYKKNVTGSTYKGYHFIICDPVTGNIYLLKEIYGGEYNDVYDHHEIVKLNSDGTSINNVNIKIFDWDANEDPANKLYMSFAISNNYLYCIYNGNVSSGVNLNKFKIDTKNSINLTEKKNIKLDTSTTTLNNITINDVLINNNKIYILCSDVQNYYDTSTGISRGALVYAELDGTNANAIGWSASNAPASADSKSEFFGPLKFISIKDKELLIADDGILDTTDVNRIVTFSTTSNTITTTTPADSGITFDDQAK